MKPLRASVTDELPENPGSSLQAKPEPPASRLLIWEIYCNVIVVIFFGTFAVQHFTSYWMHNRFSSLLIAIKETVDMGMFLFRRFPREVSSAPFAWVVGFGGFLCPLFLRPFDESGGVSLPGVIILSLGFILQIGAMLSLNRSIGIVAANRGVRTNGLYAYVRHPLYASYLLSYSGYLLENSTLSNIVWVTLSFAFFLARIKAEEDLLLRDSEYQEYAKRVPWRLIPGIV